MADVQNVDKASPGPYTAPGKRGFVKGNPGRPPGRKDSRRASGELVAAALLDLPKVQARVQAILEDEKTEPRVFVQLYTFLYEQRYGKASQHFDFDVNALAERLAVTSGLTATELVRRAEQLIGEGVN